MEFLESIGYPMDCHHKSIRDSRSKRLFTGSEKRVREKCADFPRTSPGRVSHPFLRRSLDRYSRLRRWIPTIRYRSCFPSRRLSESRHNREHSTTRHVPPRPRSKSATFSSKNLFDHCRNCDKNSGVRDLYSESSASAGLHSEM